MAGFKFNHIGKDKFPVVQVADETGSVAPAGQTKIIDENGDFINIYNPFATDNFVITLTDIDLDNSDFTGWTGDPLELFRSPFGTGIEYVGTDNPKIFKIAFNRTMYTTELGFGCNNLAKTFGADITVKLLGSGDVVRKTVGSFGGNPNSRLINIGREAFNKIQIEFPTASDVCLTNLTVRKSRDTESTIKGTDPNGNTKLVNTNILGNLLVSLDEQKDAFGRLKTAEPFTIFDNSLTSELADTLFWSNLINGTGSVAYDGDKSKYTISVATTGDYVVRSTKQRFKYQPAKSHEWFITGLLSTETGIRKRCGYVDYDNKGLGTITNAPQNGIFFENNAGTLSWNIVNNGVVTESATQENWNIDTCDGDGRSGFILNINAVNIFTCQLEWLGVGVVLVGFAIGTGAVVYCHAFQHASQAGNIDVYMRTANLPISYEITAIDSNSGSLKCICSSVISGGGFNPKGIPNAVQNSVGVAVSSGDSELLIGIRLKEDSFEYTVDPTLLSVLTTSNGNTLWAISINPTYTGTVTWSDVPNSEVQSAENNNNEILTEGIILARGSFANNADQINQELDSVLRIGKDLLGNFDELWLWVTALGNETYYGTINIKELI